MNEGSEEEGWDKNGGRKALRQKKRDKENIRTIISSARRKRKAEVEIE